MKRLLIFISVAKWPLAWPQPTEVETHGNDQRQLVACRLDWLQPLVAQPAHRRTRCKGKQLAEGMINESMFPGGLRASRAAGKLGGRSRRPVVASGQQRRVPSEIGHNQSRDVWAVLPEREHFRLQHLSR